VGRGAGHPNQAAIGRRCEIAGGFLADRPAVISTAPTRCDTA
jgi:hypothetical protein